MFLVHSSEIVHFGLATFFQYAEGNYPKLGILNANREIGMEKIEQYKQTVAKFIFGEFVIFISQVFVFFIVAVFTSDFFNSEERLVSFSEQKINSGSLAQLGLTFLAILIVIGLFSALGRIFDNKSIEYYVNEILCEMPKTIYVFGSAATGAMLAMSLFAQLNHADEVSANRFAVVTLIFALTVFAYGCGFSYAFKRKTHILPRQNKLDQRNAKEKANSSCAQTDETDI